MKILLEILDVDGNAINRVEYNSIKDCADAFKMPYHAIQRLMYMNTNKLQTRKALSPQTEQLLKKYRITPIIEEININ
jgi:hypothetical protein